MSDFKIGGIVVLKSGGPDMTIIDFDGEKFSCRWFDDEKHLQREKFSGEFLKEPSKQRDKLTAIVKKIGLISWSLQELVGPPSYKGGKETSIPVMMNAASDLHEVMRSIEQVIASLGETE